jgi:pimeloyl-ACP methyl ester carboxylesterase
LNSAKLWGRLAASFNGRTFMPGIDELFDRSGSVRPPPYPWLGSELWSLLFHHPAAPDPATLPRGDGHVVLIIPAFISGDGTTRPLRQFLTRCGYRVFGWELGVNLGPTPRVHAGLQRRLQACYALEGAPVSVIGVSLGGLLARNLAYDWPQAIRHVITLVSPFRLPTASTVAPVIQFCARYYSPAVDPRRLARPLPVPATAIFTRADGVVAWETCRSDDPGCVSLEVGGPHATICRNPRALRHVAERLAAVRELAAS